MAEIFGTLEKTVSRESRDRMVWTVPAWSRRIAQQRATANCRIKGMAEREVQNVEKIGPATIPGQSIYKVEVTGVL